MLSSVGVRSMVRPLSDKRFVDRLNWSGPASISIVGLIDVRR